MAVPVIAVATNGVVHVIDEGLPFNLVLVVLNVNQFTFLSGVGCITCELVYLSIWCWFYYV